MEGTPFLAYGPLSPSECERQGQGCIWHICSQLAKFSDFCASFLVWRVVTQLLEYYKQHSCVPIRIRISRYFPHKISVKIYNPGNYCSDLEIGF